MKYVLFILTLLTTSCSAQTVSLETAAQCRVISNCPNFTYIKDSNNSLDKYAGTWKGNYNGKIYEFNFIKKLNLGEDIKKDKLIGRMKVTDSNGTIIYNTFNEADDTKTKFRGDNFQPDLKAYMMLFIGNSDFACGEEGIVYLRIKPETPNKMSILMLQDADITWGDCPPSYQPTIPYKTSISLIRQ
ncbi:DUF6705 family protein [Chryseobacterium culicis]|uniref:DUF6705 family protein n=1 Tax=Chryseobacterium culicis TaxID=680127 RepID=UPI0018763F87|nr:DUF6705 family protein [Chryseobacterium culicis]MBE4951051.1 hypothetical protein [Chryseobacterium culicis]